MILWQGFLNHWLSQDNQHSISGKSTSDNYTSDKYSPDNLSLLMKWVQPMLSGCFPGGSVSAQPEKMTQQWLYQLSPKKLGLGNTTYLSDKRVSCTRLQ